MNIDKVNKVLKILGKRIKVVEFKGTADYTDNIEYYQLNNGKMLIIFYEFNIIKSILIQRNRWKRYTCQINGQEGTNTECIYFATYNYDIHKYDDILQLA